MGVNGAVITEEDSAFGGVDKTDNSVSTNEGLSWIDLGKKEAL